MADSHPSVFARHFGPAALRREVRARFGVEAEPRRVAAGDRDLRRALVPCRGARLDGARLAGAWAARVTAGFDERRQGGDTVRADTSVWLVCALYAGESTRVVWGAVRLGGSRAGYEFRFPGTIHFGRATGPAFLNFSAGAAPARLYATNDAGGSCPTCGTASMRCIATNRTWWVKPGAVYPCDGLVVAHEDADRYAVAYGLNCGLASMIVRSSKHAPLVGLRRRGGRVLPPARLAAGRAYYRDAPRLAAATARLGRRGPAALRHTYASAD